MKSTVVPNRLTFLFVDVFIDHLIRNRAGCDRKIPPRPEMSAPILLLEVWELLEQETGAGSLEPLHDLADILMGAIADEHMYMVRRYLAGDNVKLVLNRNLAQEVAHPRRHWPRQHSLAVLRAPHQVNLEIVLRVTAKAISSHNATSSTLPFA